MEGAHYINTGELIKLSEQQLVSCNNLSMDESWTGGCRGAYITSAYDYAEMHKLATESNYPYTS